MSETITDTETGEVYAVETEQRLLSELFPWMRGSEWDKVVNVGVTVDGGGDD